MSSRERAAGTPVCWGHDPGLCTHPRAGARLVAAQPLGNTFISRQRIIPAFFSFLTPRSPILQPPLKGDSNILLNVTVFYNHKHTSSFDPSEASVRRCYIERAPSSAASAGMAVAVRQGLLVGALLHLGWTAFPATGWLFCPEHQHPLDVTMWAQPGLVLEARPFSLVVSPRDVLATLGNFPLQMGYYFQSQVWKF